MKKLLYSKWVALLLLAVIIAMFIYWVYSQRSPGYWKGVVEQTNVVTR